MRKTLLTVAVLTAFSVSTSAADWNTGTQGALTVDADGNVAYETVTISGGSSSSDTSKIVSIRSPESAHFNNVVMNGYEGSSAAGSYLKSWTTEVSINQLTLTAAPEGESYSSNTLEFWGLAGTNQTFAADSVNIGDKAILRVQTSTAQNTNPDQTQLQIGKLNLEGTAAVALGANVAGFISPKDGADVVTVDEITTSNGYEGSLTGIAVASNASNSKIEIGTINVNDNTFSLAVSSSDVPSIGLNGVNLKNSTLTGQEKNNGVVAINMNSATSKLVLGNVGEQDGESSTTLNINFSEAAASSTDATVTVVKDASIAENTSIKVTAANQATGDAAQNAENLQSIANKVVQESTEGTAASVADEVTLTSNIFDEVSAQIGDDGLVNASSIRIVENAEVVGFAQLHSVSLMQWRSEMNHMQYRLGEIRDHKGYNNGVWVRAYNGKDKYGSQSVENEYIGIQFGYDHKIEGTNFIIGGAVNYAHGDSDFNAGEGDNHNVAFTAYGTWLADSGLFVDVTGKIGRLSNDVTIGGYTAGYDTNAVSLSAEAGWRVPLTQSFYVEPQVEMMYGHVSGADYDTQNYKAKMDAVDMFVGRLGVQAGLVCPQNKGSVYLRASVLHDFDGEASTRFTDKANLTGPGRTVEDDLGGTWYELGIGAHYNVTDTTYIYADFQYADGDETESPWRWMLGVRKAF